jgi:hypothetical protein
MPTATGPFSAPAASACLATDPFAQGFADPRHLPRPDELTAIAQHAGESEGQSQSWRAVCLEAARSGRPGGMRSPSADLSRLP